MTSTLVEVKKIEPNSWNPNVMQDAEFEALKQDMRVHGVNGVDPILVSIKKIFYGSGPVRSEEFDSGGLCVIIDGEHRWRIAKELGWKEIRCEVQNIREEDAKALCYRRNRERGTIDPFKEAVLFKGELGKMTQKAVAGKYGVDQSTVSHRLSLLKVDSQVLESVQKLPRGIITASHLEPLATLEVEDQKKLAKDIMFEAKQYNQPMTVKEIERRAERFKEDREEANKLAEALKTAKFPKCPKCGKEPRGIQYKGLPWVECSSGNYDHSWSLNSGKFVYEPIRESQNTLDGKSKPIKPKVIRSVHTIKELADVFGDRCREIVPKLDKVTSIRIHGRLENETFDMDFSAYGSSTSFSMSQGHRQLWFRAEAHDYKTGEKSSVDAGSPDKVEDIKKLIESAFQGKLEIPASKRIKGKIPDSSASAIPEKLDLDDEKEPLYADQIATVEEK